MAVKVGDRISIDTRKIGQARRGGAVIAITEGLSGLRLEVRWDDGNTTTFSPGAGTLLVEPKRARAAKKPAAKKPATRKPAAKKAVAAKKPAAKKAAAAKKPAAKKKPAGKKPAAKKPAAKRKR